MKASDTINVYIFIPFMYTATEKYCQLPDIDLFSDASTGAIFLFKSQHTFLTNVSMVWRTF